MKVKFILTTCLVLVATFSLTSAKKKQKKPGYFWKLDEAKKAALGKSCCKDTINKTELYEHIQPCLERHFDKSIKDPECEDSWDNLGLTNTDWKGVGECYQHDFLMDAGQVTWKQVEEYLNNDIPKENYLCPGTADDMYNSLKSCFDDYKTHQDYYDMVDCCVQSVFKTCFPNAKSSFRNL